MKLKNLLHSLLFGVAVWVFMLAPANVFAAFGVSPPWIINDNIKPGSQLEYKIDLSTDKPDQEMLVKSSVTGDPEIIEWVKIRDQEDLKMPKGENLVPMYVDVNVPPEAISGKYRGNIRVTLAPKKSGEEGNVSILLGGNISVKLDVVREDVIDYWVKSSSIEHLKEGEGGPLNLNLMLRNLGNTIITNVETKVTITDKAGNFITESTANELTNPIPLNATENTGLSIPISDLEAGDYWVNISVLKDGQEVYQNKLHLNVKAKEPEVKEKAKVKIPISLKDPSVQLVFVIVVSLIAALIIFIIFRGKGRKRR